MSIEKQIHYAESRHGRIYLHLRSLVHDHRLLWHWAGIIREIKAV